MEITEVLAMKGEFLLGTESFDVDYHPPECLHLSPQAMSSNEDTHFTSMNEAFSSNHIYIRTLCSHNIAVHHR